MCRVAMILITALLAGCANLSSTYLPRTMGEERSGYAYVPLDPLPVVDQFDFDCRAEESLPHTLRDGKRAVPLLDSLPDNAVRVAILNKNNKSGLSFGESSLGLENQRYLVILDYVNVETSNITFVMSEPFDVDSSTISYRRIERLDQRERIRTFFSAPPTNSDELNVVIPVYVGVGLRLTADITVLKGKVNLASLGAIAAGVEAGRVSGSLVVQTLGVSGQQVTSALPLPSEINQTTVQAAILAMGSIKAVLFDPKTRITPRVTGMHLTIQNASDRLVNSVVSELARRPIPLYRGCEEDKGKMAAAAAGT